MKEIKLDVQLRQQVGGKKVKELRKTGAVPAVVYGAGEDPISIQVDHNTFVRVARQHEGESLVFHLQVKDGDKAVKDFSALLQEIQHHPVSDAITHIDFLRISLDKEITIQTPVILHGEAVGLKESGATLEQHLREFEVVCLPKNVPQHIDIDITSLELHHSIHVKDVTPPAGVTIQNDPEEVVVAIAFAAQEEAPSEEEETAAEPEVLSEKPKDEEEKKPAGGEDKGKEE